MPPIPPYPRHLESLLSSSLEDMPVVLLHGPRQSGKTTLARAVGAQRGYAYYTFDDEAIHDAARQDPVGFVAALPERAILDEVQRVPELFTSIKVAVDENRAPGRFILTGSANVLRVPRLSDSLAGRMAILRLHPLSQSELSRNSTGFLDDLLDARFPVRLVDRLGDELIERVVAGGYPTALAFGSATRRAAWYRDYVETQVQRDVLDLSRIHSLDALPRLMSLAAANTATLINMTELAGPFQLTRQTIDAYVTLLERIFLLERVAPWHSNRLTRLVKRPKLHVGDTGVAAALLGVDSSDLSDDRRLFGQLLETFVLQELTRQASWREKPLSFHHFRDRDGAEVDIVMEQGVRHVVGVEVKAAASVRESDFSGLKKLRSAAGERFKAGVVLYDGATATPFGDRLFAVPLRSLWES